jgi:hypothetical protein
MPAMLDYFRRCRTVERERAFAAAVGQTVAAFETEMLRYLRSLD